MAAAKFPRPPLKKGPRECFLAPRKRKKKIMFVWKKKKKFFPEFRGFDGRRAAGRRAPKFTVEGLYS